ncbi:MAG: hypothetical protein WCF33_10765 [Pseudonocardiaceae bacterium]
MVWYGIPEHSASVGPLAPSRLPLGAPPAGHLEGPIVRQAGPRPWGTRFAVPAVIAAKHRKRPTHGVHKKETKYIDDGKEHTDSIDEPYEDEVDE